MADAALAAQSQAATSATRVGRYSDTASVRGVSAARPVSDVAGIQRQFFIPPKASAAVPEKRQENRSGTGLLSNGAQMLLAETRTQEASVTFVTPTSYGHAIASYTAVQSKIKETMLANGSGAAYSGTPASHGSALPAAQTSVTAVDKLP